MSSMPKMETSTHQLTPVPPRKRATFFQNCCHRVFLVRKSFVARPHLCPKMTRRSRPGWICIARSCELLPEARPLERVGQLSYRLLVRCGHSASHWELPLELV